MQFLILLLCPFLLLADFDYTYDENGRVSTIWTSDKTIGYSYKYNEEGLICSALDLVSGMCVHRFYDQGMISREIFSPDDPDLELEKKDPYGHLLKLEGVQFVYDPFDRLARAFLPEKFCLVFSYDGFHRCLRQDFYEWEEGWVLKKTLHFRPFLPSKENIGFCVLVGTLLQQYCYHVIPFAGVRDAGILIGEWLGAPPIPLEDKTCAIGYVGEKRETDARVHVLVNGLNTNLQDTVSFARFLSNALQGEKVIYAYNATHGVMPDIWEYFFLKAHIPTHALDISLEAVKKAVAEVGKDGTVILWAHSLGGVIVEKVLQNITSEEKSRLQIFTFGTSSFFSKEGTKDVIHFLSPKDMIPFIGDPIFYFYAPWSDPSLVQMTVPCVGWTLANHAFMGPAYKNKILQLCNELKK